tara:strand:+ start:255 stop:425 length:171 start_codon:yes stop_codon:yes gene_type:complete
MVGWVNLQILIRLPETNPQQFHHKDFLAEDQYFLFQEEIQRMVVAVAAEHQPQEEQ